MTAERIRLEKEAEAAAKVKKKAAEKTAPKINKAKIKAEIAAIEEEIAQKEERLAVLSEELGQSGSYQDEESGKALVNEYHTLETEITLLYEKWEDLSLTLENN